MQFIEPVRRWFKRPVLSAGPDHGRRQAALLLYGVAGAAMATPHSALAQAANGTLPKLPLQAGGTGASNPQDALNGLGAQRTLATRAIAAMNDLSAATEVMITRWTLGAKASPSLYVKVSAQPAHGACFKDAAGSWFEYAEPEIRVYALGALGNYNDDTAAFQLAADVARARGAGSIYAQNDNFITSAQINIYSDRTYLEISGSEIVKTGTTGYVFNFGFANPGADDLRSNVGAKGGTLVCNNAGVTSGGGINFERCQFVYVDNVRTYGCFVGFNVASCLNATYLNPKTDCGQAWTTVKGKSAGMCLTRSPGSSSHNSAIVVIGGNLEGSVSAQNYESSLRLEEVDGLEVNGTNLSFSKRGVSYVPYDSNAFLSLIKITNCKNDSATEYSYYAPASPGYAGSFNSNTIEGGYIYNSANFGLFGLETANPGLAQPCMSVRVPDCHRCKGDGFVVTAGQGYRFDCTFWDMNTSGAGGSCIRLQSVTDVIVGGSYRRKAGDNNRAFQFVKIEGTSDDITILPGWKYKSDVTYIPAITRDPTCGPDVQIGEGKTSENTLVASAAALSIPPSLRDIVITGTVGISGVNAASSWKNRKFTALVQDGAPLNSSSSFFLKGGVSRTGTGGSILSMWCIDGTNWREI